MTLNPWSWLIHPSLTTGRHLKGRALLFEKRCVEPGGVVNLSWGKGDCCGPVATDFTLLRLTCQIGEFSKSKSNLPLLPAYKLDSFRFQDEDDNEIKISSILSSARASISVILAGKCGSRRHSDTSFGENLVVAKTSYQMLGILSFSDRERALPPSTEISELTFVVKNSTMTLSGVSIFR